MSGVWATIHRLYFSLLFYVIIIIVIIIIVFFMCTHVL